MQFELDGKEVCFDEFQEILPLDRTKFSKIFLESEGAFTLGMKAGVLSLRCQNYRPIEINLGPILEKHRNYFYTNSFYKDPLAKAIGLKPGRAKPVVLDASAGLLGDSSLLYSYGIKKLYLVERHSIVANLIKNALERYPLTNTEFFYGNLSEMPFRDFDVAFFDPMYSPGKNKSAPKKEMSVLRQLIGSDVDQFDCANFLLDKTKSRLVLKRSAKSGPLLENPDFSIKGKSTCYDVYLKQR